MKKTWITKSLSLLLVLATLFGVGPFHALAAVTHAEETTKELYVKSVKLAQAKTREEAKLLLEEEGYIFLDSNLNEGTNADGIWLGYTTTTDPAEAIYDMKLMHTEGGYTLTSMASVLELQKENFRQMATDLQYLIDEFVAAYHAGRVPAQKAYKALNFFRMVKDETDLGEQDGLGYRLVNGGLTQNQLIELILFCDPMILDSVIKFLTMGIQLTTGNWMADLSKLGAYDSEKEYAEDETELNYRAKQMLLVLQIYAKTYNAMDKMNLVSGTIDENGKIVPDKSKANPNEVISAEMADMAKNDMSRVLAYKLVFDELAKYSYGKKTLKDFFCSLEKETNEKVLYPLASILSDGEFAALSYGCFLELALGINVDVSSYDQYDENYEKLTEEVKSLYLYEGVNPVLLEDDTVIGFTDQALRDMAMTGEYQFYEKESWGEHAWETGKNVAWGIYGLGLGVMVVSKTTLGIMSFMGVLAAASAADATGFAAGLFKVCAFLGGGYFQLITVAAALVAALVAYLCYLCDEAQRNKVDWSKNPIPEYIYDSQEVGFAETSKNDYITTDYVKRPMHVFYEVVRDIHGKPVDLNARASGASKWVAMYVSYDRPGDESKPIKADSFLVKKGSGELPSEEYTPATRFGEVIAYNLNQWEKSDDANGIYMFYQQDKQILLNSNKTYYIYSVYLQTGESPAHCIKLLENAGYTPLNVNLTPDYKTGVLSSEPVYTYLGYQLTDNPNEAITDLRMEYGGDMGQVQNGAITYASCGSSAGVTLYETKYKAAGTPLLASGLICVNDRDEAPLGYEPVNFFAGGPAVSFNYLSDSGIRPNMTEYFLYFLPETTFTKGTKWLGGISYMHIPKDAFTELLLEHTNGYPDSMLAYLKKKTGRDYPIGTWEEIKRMMYDYVYCKFGYHTINENAGEFFTDAVVTYTTYNPYRAIYDIKGVSVKDLPAKFTYESKGYSEWNTTVLGSKYLSYGPVQYQLYSFVYNGHLANEPLELNGRLFVSGNPYAKDNVYDAKKKSMTKQDPLTSFQFTIDSTGGNSNHILNDSHQIPVQDIFGKAGETFTANRNGSKTNFAFYIFRGSYAEAEKSYVSSIVIADSLSIYRAAGGAASGIKRSDITPGMVIAQLAKQGANVFSPFNTVIGSDKYFGGAYNELAQGKVNLTKFGYTRTGDADKALRDVFIYFNGFNTDAPPRELYRGKVKYTVICKIPYNLTGYEEAPGFGAYLYGTTDKRAGERIIDVQFSDTPFLDGYEAVRTMNGRSMWGELRDFLKKQETNHIMEGARTLFKMLAKMFGKEYSYDTKGDYWYYEKFFYINIKREGGDLHEQKPYISDLYVAGVHKNANDPFNMVGILDELFDQGADAYLPFELHGFKNLEDPSKLNGIGADFRLLGYKYTADPTDAITEIRVSYMSSSDPQKTKYGNYDAVYHLASEHDLMVADKKKDTQIYLYYTKSQNPNVGSPITDITYCVGPEPSYHTTDTAEILPVMRYDSWKPAALGPAWNAPIYLSVVRPFERPNGSYVTPTYGNGDKTFTRPGVSGSAEGKYIAALYVMDKNTLRQEKLAAGVPSDQCTCAKISDQEVFNRLKEMGATTVIETPFMAKGGSYKNNQNKVFIGYSRTDKASSAIKNIVIKATLLSQEEPSELISLNNDTYNLVAQAAKKVTSLPKAINLIGIEDGDDFLIPGLYLYTTTDGKSEPIRDISIDTNPLVEHMVTVRSENGIDPYADIHEQAKKQAELGNKDDKDSKDEEIIYSDELYKWMEDVADLFHPEDAEVTPYYIHCKKHDGNVLEDTLPYIDQIYIAWGDSAHEALSKLVAFEPQGFVNYDLNKGAGGKYVYMAYTRTDKKSEGITDLIVSNPFVHTANPAETWRLKHGSTVVRYDLVANVNLNEGAIGNPLYLYATKNSAAGEPIRGMWTRNSVLEEYPQGFAITTVKFADEKGYTNDDPDLNKGALGKYIYLIVRRERPATSSLAGMLIGVGSVVAISLLLATGATVAAVVVVKRKKNRHVQ